MTPADQVKLCALLNTGSPRIVWEPDPGAIGGGVLARLGSAGRLMARRDVGPTYGHLKLQLWLVGVVFTRPTTVIQGADLKGRGWHKRAADALRAASTSLVAAHIQRADGEFDAILAEPETPERALKLCKLEERRTALANCIGAC